MKDVFISILILSAVIVALAPSITALTVNPTGNVMGYYSLQSAGTIIYDEFNDMGAWTGDISSTAWHTSSYSYNIGPTAAYKDAYGSHYMTHSQSTVGYSNITVSFAALNRLQDAGESLRMEWYDGTTWTSKGSLPRALWASYSYDLPASAANNPNFAIKFVCYDWHMTDAYDWCQIDSVKIMGTATAQTCSDGTAYGQCSVTKPKYCANGTLIDNCVACGCPSDQNCAHKEPRCSHAARGQEVSVG